MTSLHTKEYKQMIQRLRQARLDAGFSQAEVAVALDRPQSFVSKFETAQRRLDVLELKTLLKIYGLDFEDFMNQK